MGIEVPERDLAEHVGGEELLSVLVLARLGPVGRREFEDTGWETILEVMRANRWLSRLIARDPTAQSSPSRGFRVFERPDSRSFRLEPNREPTPADERLLASSKGRLFSSGFNSERAHNWRPSVWAEASFRRGRRRLCPVDTTC